MTYLFLFSRYFLAAVFAVAALAKLRNLAGTRQALIEFGISGWLARRAALLLPASELACAAGLIPPVTAKLAALALAVLLTIFTAAIGLNLLRGRRPSCACFGAVNSSPIGPQTILRNLVLLAMAGCGATGRLGFGASAALTGEITSPMPVILAILAATLAATTWLAFHLLRQNGRLMIRLEAVEAKLGIDPPHARPPAGLPVGTAAPSFFVEQMPGHKISSRDLLDTPLPVLLVFTGSNCGACEALYADFARWHSEERSRLLVVPIVSGPAAGIRAQTEAHGFTNVFLPSGSNVADLFLAAATPSAVLLRGAKVASPLAEGAEAIRQLANDTLARAMPALSMGHPVPALQVKDLNGKPFEVASLLGHRTVLLFWSTTCGYCSQMLDDIKMWERQRSHAAPELIVVSAGSLAENRAQSFRSRVLLDGEFIVGDALGSSGTPSALLIDESARIASEVQVGAQEVLALLEAATPVAAIRQEEAIR